MSLGAGGIPPEGGIVHGSFYVNFRPNLGVVGVLVKWKGGEETEALDGYERLHGRVA